MTHLHSAVGQLHHNSRLGSEPLVHVRYSGNGVTLFHSDGIARLHQMLVHVLQEEIHQSHFLLEIGRILLDRVVQFVALAVDVVYVEAIRQHYQPRAVVVHHADTVVGQLVAETVLVRIIHPLAYPDYRLCRWVGHFVCVIHKEVCWKLCIENYRNFFLINILCTLRFIFLKTFSNTLVT